MVLFQQIAISISSSSFPKTSECLYTSGGLLFKEIIYQPNSVLFAVCS
jgi:hypothetical protein